MSDETARIIQLEQELREAKDRLALDPQHQIGEVLAVLARIEKRQEVASRDLDAVWQRTGEAIDLAKRSLEASQHVGTLTLETHQETLTAISALPCNRPNGGGNGTCPCSDTERPPLHAVEL